LTRFVHAVAFSVATAVLPEVLVAIRKLKDPRPFHSIAHVASAILDERLCAVEDPGAFDPACVDLSIPVSYQLVVCVR
jgi:hypothetical protein